MRGLPYMSASTRKHAGRLAMLLVVAVSGACDGGGTETTLSDVTGGRDTSAPVACETAATCPKPANPCEVAVCVGGFCEGSPAPAGTFVPDETQLAGDCKTISCGEGGAFVTAADPGDVPEDDGDPCTSEACDGPNATHPAAAAGTTCALGEGDATGFCTDAGVCAECRAGEATCDGAVPRSCDADGAWVSEEACPFVCSGAGQCTGVCVPGTRDCAGKQPRLCDAAGQWQADGVMCENVCSAGACAGSCSPGSLQCEGNIPKACDESGAWQATPACPFACLSGQCTGLCVPASTRCQGTAIQTCGPTGQWTTTNSCPFLCDGGTCAGICTPGTKRCVGRTSQTCDGNGQWVESQTCMFACSAGDCGGVCEPGATRCSGNLAQTCDSQGQWQTTDTCVNACLGAGSCGGVCRPGATRCTGQNAETCDQTGQWIATPCTNVCQNGSYTGVCTPGAARCNGAQSQSCNTNGQWTTTQTCPYVCSGAGTCSGQCAPASTRCSGTTPQTCDQAGLWSSLADCTYACQSGACTGVCRPGGTRCVGNAAQSCDATGQWQTSQTCPYICASGACGGVCVPGTTRCNGNTPQTCDQNGQWSGATACSGTTPICSSGACIRQYCGDANVDAGEQCDDGNGSVCDGCESCQYRRWLALPSGAKGVVPSLETSLPQQDACYEAWVRTTSAVSDAIFMAATRSGTESNFILRCYVQGSRLQFAVQSSNSNAIIIEVTKACGDSQWHHVAACRDVEGSATTLTLFWDGQLIGSKAGATTAIGPRTSVVFGGVNYAADGLGGQIDEVRISSAVRYVSNFTPQRRLEADVNTTALFHFDETSGTAFTSVQGHAGTLSGSAAWQTDTGYLSGYCAAP